MTSRRISVWVVFPALFALSLLAILLCVCVGAMRIDPATSLKIIFNPLYQAQGSQRVIVFDIRLSRALMAYCAGGTLAVTGACLQGVFRNPMADSHVLGVSSGAALGAAAAIILGWQSAFLGQGGVTTAAFIGGLACVFCVYWLAQARGRLTTVSLLLAGVAVSYLASAMISGLMIANRNKLEHVMLWTMGSFTNSNWKSLSWAAPTMLIGVAWCMFYLRPLNLMLMGEEEAQTMGVDVASVRRKLLCATTLATAASVSVSGIVGFVGLVVPHAVRLLAGPDCRKLLPLSFFAGGLFLLIMDTLARTLLAPIELPVGVLTSLIGGPFFLYLLRRKSA